MVKSGNRKLQSVHIPSGTITNPQVSASTSNDDFLLHVCSGPACHVLGALLLGEIREHGPHLLLCRLHSNIHPRFPAGSGTNCLLHWLRYEEQNQRNIINSYFFTF